MLFLYEECNMLAPDVFNNNEHQQKLNLIKDCSPNLLSK